MKTKEKFDNYNELKSYGPQDISRGQRFRYSPFRVPIINVSATPFTQILGSILTSTTILYPCVIIC